MRAEKMYCEFWFGLAVVSAVEDLPADPSRINLVQMSIAVKIIRCNKLIQMGDALFGDAERWMDLGNCCVKVGLVVKLYGD